MTTSPTPATPSPEQKAREAILHALPIGLDRVSQSDHDRIITALQSSGCLKSEGANLNADCDKITVGQNVWCDCEIVEVISFQPEGVEVKFFSHYGDRRCHTEVRDANELNTVAERDFPTSHQPAPSDGKHDRKCIKCGAPIYQGVLCAECHSPSQPPCDDEHVAPGCSLFSDPTKTKPPAPISSAPDGAGTPTPETDVFEKPYINQMGWTSVAIACADFARKLEQQRDALKAELAQANQDIKNQERVSDAYYKEMHASDGYRVRLDKAESALAQAQRELLETKSLLGAERGNRRIAESALQSASQEVEGLKRDKERLRTISELWQPNIRGVPDAVGDAILVGDHNRMCDAIDVIIRADKSRSATPEERK